MPPDRRPLSPHLQIYSWQLTSVLSIIHRVTGVVLAIGALVLAAWLMALAGGTGAYDAMHMMVGTLIGKLAMFAVSFSLFYHLFNGLRHLAWDAGQGFAIAQMYKSGYAVVILSLLATVSVWYVALTAGRAG